MLENKDKGFEAMKKVCNGIVKENIEIARNVFQMVIELRKSEADDKGHFAEMQPKPGQFVNVYLKDKSRILPRPISICMAENGILTLVYGVVGKGTEELSSYAKDDLIRFSSPNGNGFDISPLETIAKDKVGFEKNIFLIGGGIGVPPLLQLAKEIFNMKNDGLPLKIIGIIGFREEVFLKRELSNYCDEVHVATDIGKVGFHGNVVELIRAAKLNGDYAFACGPKIMLKNLNEYCLSKTSEESPEGIPLQVSMEERMGCGYGACVGCTCKIKAKEDKDSLLTQGVSLKKICTEGPIFMGNEVEWNE